MNAARPLFTGTAVRSLLSLSSTSAHNPTHAFQYQTEQEVLPHVYTSSSLRQNNILSNMGSKYLLPVDTERHLYEVLSAPAKIINHSLITDEEPDMNRTMKK